MGASMVFHQRLDHFFDHFLIVYNHNNVPVVADLVFHKNKYKTACYDVKVGGV